MSSEQKGRRAPSAVRLPPWVLLLLSAILLAIVLAGAWWLFGTVRGIASSLPAEVGEFVPDGDVEADQTPATGESPAEAQGDEPLPVIETDALKPWSGSERVNILFLGTDQRCDEEGPNHSDTLMIATVDPKSMSAALFSLPRDLWVEIPGFGVDRINQAYYFGQIYEYPGGGPALAQETVEALLGIPIDYYVTVDFKSFEQAVDLIGGIVIDVSEAIDDPDYPDNCYGYEPFSIQVGKQRLDGATALKYARTRATFGGDVDRAARQQAVLMAVRDQVMRLNQLPQLIAQSPALWRNFKTNVKTNLPLEDALELALLMQDISAGNIRSVVLDYDQVYIETTPDGRQVLVPRREEIRQLRDEVFAMPAIPTPVIDDLQHLMENESARVAIYNGTAVFGLAADTQAYLEDIGINVAEIGNADSATYKTSRIVDYGSHPYTARYLVQQMGIPPLNVSEETEPEGAYDLLVILGNDWASRIGGDST
ncbi:MAG: LCP family protein [Candidatus Promineifilaceae bacterium]|jgi:polyisoprenyl-teichoic acid--peptidoglycan teichoic acid transferase